MSGGMTDEAQRSSVMITHADGTTETVDMVDLEAKAGNVPLRLNDRVYVPLSTQRVVVLGGVNKPDAFPFDDKHPMSIVEAIVLRGALLGWGSSIKSSFYGRPAGRPNASLFMSN